MIYLNKIENLEDVKLMSIFKNINGIDKHISGVSGQQFIDQKSERNQLPLKDMIKSRLIHIILYGVLHN